MCVPWNPGFHNANALDVKRDRDVRIICPLYTCVNTFKAGILLVVYIQIFRSQWFITSCVTVGKRNHLCILMKNKSFVFEEKIQTTNVCIKLDFIVNRIQFRLKFSLTMAMVIIMVVYVLYEYTNIVPMLYVDILKSTNKNNKINVLFFLNKIVFTKNNIKVKDLA